MHVVDDAVRLPRLMKDLVDRDEITRLIYRLAVCLDEGRFDELPSIFTADATARTPGGVAQGRDALIAQASRNHSTEQRIQHVVSNVLVDVDGDRAGVRANLIATFARVGETSQARIAPEPQFMLGEVYRFESVRTPQGWRLSSVETVPVWTSGTRS